MSELEKEEKSNAKKKEIDGIMKQNRQDYMKKFQTISQGGGNNSANNISSTFVGITDLKVR